MRDSILVSIVIYYISLVLVLSSLPHSLFYASPLFLSFTDRNDFITRSGWFSFSGLALGKEAQLNVLARKAKMNYKDFMAITKAVYMFSYRGEKVKKRHNQL